MKCADAARQQVFDLLLRKLDGGAPVLDCIGIEPFKAAEHRLRHAGAAAGGEFAYRSDIVDRQYARNDRDR